MTTDLSHGHQPLLTSCLQASHLALGEVHRAGLDLTHLIGQYWVNLSSDWLTHYLKVSRLTGKGF